ncbi:MAG: ATP-binding cassette domain-containing protein [Kiritimatiellae bacterium]|nr:ATP-binding cassette domain-containing protein [Kiritimatiellia bacterium]MBR6588339.1 ATP-binding cassette domain-containing protein [Kiritimatiellia bacterium]
MEMENVIELEHVDAGYPGVKILEDVSFSIRRGEIFVLLGGSGCGKSTIMRHMIGLNAVQGGVLRVLGMEMNRKNRSRILRKIGVMYQSGALFGSMTCLQNVMLPLEEFTRLRKKQRMDKARELLAQVGLADAESKMPSEISGGMKKRVAIARALALEPEIIFLDEPSAGLDPITSSALDDLILQIRKDRGTTFVVVTHELPSIFKIADRCAMFDKARRGMIAIGSPAELRNSSDDQFVRRFFGRGS